MNPDDIGKQRSFSTRVLSEDDLDSCVSLDRISLNGLWSAGQWRSELLEPGRICIGLHLAGTLVAMASGWLVLDELQINVVAVDPTQRRQGLGRSVLEALMEEARQQGAIRATLEVASCNQAAIALYERCGFLTSGTRRAYYCDGRDALIQWADLT